VVTLYGGADNPDSNNYRGIGSACCSCRLHRVRLSTASIGMPTGVVHEPNFVAPAMAWAIADFEPDSDFGSDPDYYRAANWTVSGADVQPDIHFLAGNVTSSASTPNLQRVTIVETGTVSISGNNTLSPAVVDERADTL